MATAKIRLGLLGLGREHLDLMPALYRDPQASVVWVYGGEAAATVARLGSLFSFPAVSELDADSLAQTDLIIRPATEAPEWEGKIPEHIPVITDAELAALHADNSFRWAELTWPASGGAREPSLSQAAPDPQNAEDVAKVDAQDDAVSPENDRPREGLVCAGDEPAPAALPVWFAHLSRAAGLGAWFVDRLADLERPAPACCLALLTPGGGCVAVYGTGLAGEARRERFRRRLGGRLPQWGAADGAEPPAVLKSLPADICATCGLPPGPMRLLWREMRGHYRAVLMVGVGRAGEPVPRAWLTAADDFLQGESRGLQALVDLTITARQAREWRRLRSVVQRLNGRHPGNRDAGA